MITKKINVKKTKSGFENMVLIDYLTVTFKIPTVTTRTGQLIYAYEPMDFIQRVTKPFRMGHESWTETRATAMYKNAIELRIDAQSRITVEWDNVNDFSSVKLEISGRPCRFLEEYVFDDSYGWKDFLSYFLTLNKAKYTRADLAYDDVIVRKKNDEITLEMLEKKIEKGHYFNKGVRGGKYGGKRKSKVVTDMPWKDSKGAWVKGKTIYMGTRSGDTMFLRIYDKRAEQLTKGYEVSNEKWIRYEMEYKGNYADQMIRAILESDKAPGTLYAETLNQFVTFTTANGEPWRAWERFLSGVDYLKLPTSVTPSTIENIEKYVFEQCSPSMAMWIDAHAGIYDPYDMFDKALNYGRSKYRQNKAKTLAVVDFNQKALKEHEKNSITPPHAIELEELDWDDLPF